MDGFWFFIIIGIVLGLVVRQAVRANAQKFQERHGQVSTGGGLQICNGLSRHRCRSELKFKRLGPYKAEAVPFSTLKAEGVEIDQNLLDQIATSDEVGGAEVDFYLIESRCGFTSADVPKLLGLAGLDRPMPNEMAGLVARYRKVLPQNIFFPISGFKKYGLEDVYPWMCDRDRVGLNTLTNGLCDERAYLAGIQRH